MSGLPQFHITAVFNGEISFSECILMCTGGLRELGYEVTYADNQLRPDAINIVFASYTHLTDSATWTAMSRISKNIIIYNWEQVSPDVPWFTPRYFRQMVNTHVWDYNAGNVAGLKTAGVADVHHVPMAYTPAMSRVVGVEQDIDVLFYGAINERRSRVIEQLRARGLHVHVIDGNPSVGGAERDNYIARAKVVLNLHRFDVAKVFEIARVSYLLANHKAVVSEIADGTDIDDDIRAAVVGGHIDDLPQLCYDLVHDEPRRRELEQKGFDIFSRRNAAQVMKTAVDRYLAQTHYGNPAEHSVALPDTLHIGAADKWNYSYCNIDKRADLAPDLTIDIGQPIPFDQPLHSWRFGNVILQRNSFQKIIAHNVFQRVDDLKLALTNCLELLAVGGNMELTVPLDLSYDAWMHIDDKRAFNDKTWESIINNWWQHGWGDYRFEIRHMGFGLHNEYGHQVIAANGGDWGVAIKTPRAIDTISVTLHKRPLKDDEPQQLPQTRFMD